MESSFFGFIKTLLVVLAAGGGEKAGEPSRVSRRLYPGPVPIYAQLQVSDLRKLMRSDKQAQAVLFGDRKPAEALAQALAELARLSGIPKEKLAAHCNNLRGIGFWYLAFAENEESQRLLIVADFGKKSDVAGILKSCLGRKGRYLKSTYAKREVHQFWLSRRSSLWLTEHDGLVAIATDPPAVKRYILSQKKAAAPEKGKKADPALALLELDGEALLNSLVPLLERHDREEFFAASEIFDLAAYKSLKARLTPAGVEATLGLEKASDAARLLKANPKGAKLLEMLPKKGACGIAVSLDNAPQIMKYVESVMARVFPRMRRSPIDEIRRELTREIGVDIDKDIVANLAAVAYMVPGLARERDLEQRGVFLFEAKEAKKAMAVFNKLMDAAAADEANVAVEALKNGKFAEIGRRGQFKLGIQNGVVAISGGREVVAKEIISILQTKVDKVKKDGTLAVLVLDLAKILQVEIKPIRASLSRKENKLILKSDFQLQSLLITLLGKAKGGKALPWRAGPIIVQNAGNLKQIGLGCLMYSGEHTGAFPPNLKKLVEDGVFRDDKVCFWTNPGLGKPQKLRYIYCPGYKDDHPQATRTMIAADPKPYKGKRNALFIDGHIELLPELRFQQLAKAQGWKPGVGLIKKDIPKVKQEEIRKLCRQLGSPRFKERTAAKKKLKALGVQAFPILEEFKNHKDPEVRMLVKELLGQK